MTPNDILDLAGELATASTEAAWRAAVSRAYFAAFHAARILLRAMGFEVPQGERAHAYLWLHLANCGHPDVAEAGATLNDLRHWRNVADYDIDEPFFHVAAAGQVQGAIDVIGLLESVPSVPSELDSITAAIRDYERDVLKEVTWRPPNGPAA